MKLTSTIILLLFSLCSVSLVSSKMLIITFSYNRPDFIELQHKLFQKFLQDEYEFIVFDDSQNSKITDEIKSVCQKYNIKYIKIPQEIHDRPYLHRVANPWWLSEYNAPSVRNCNVVQYALDILGFDQEDLIILLESDVFLIKEFSFIKYMQNYDLAGYNRSNDQYQNLEYMPDGTYAVKESNNSKNTAFLWIGLIYLKMRTIPHKQAFNINCGLIDNVMKDSGGYLYYYLSNNPQTQIKFFNKIRIEEFVCGNCDINKSYRCNHNQKRLQECGFNNNTIQFIQEVPIDWGTGVNRPNNTVDGLGRRNIEFLNDNNFVHFNGASGYANSSFTCDIKQFYKDKTDAFTKYINTILYN